MKRISSLTFLTVIIYHFLNLNLEGNVLKRESCFPYNMALPLDVLEKAVNQHLSLLLKDGRIIEGKLSGYDEYMNMVLEDVEEITEETKKRLGRIILRGNNVVSISIK